MITVSILPMTLDSILRYLGETICRPLERSDCIDIRSLIYNLLITEEWSSKELSSLHSIEEKLDINKKLYCYYSLTWKKNCDEILSDPWQSILTILIYKALLSDKTQSVDAGVFYKRANVLFKSLEISAADWLVGPEGFKSSILEAVEMKLKKLRFTEPVTKIEETGSVSSRAGFETIPLTVLFYEGPIGRAYLQTLHSLGMKPARIIHLVSSLDLSTHKPVAPYLPRFLRKHLACYLQKFRIHFWSRHITRELPKLKKRLLRLVENALNFQESTIIAANSDIPLKNYSTDIQMVFVNGLKDEKLVELFANYPKSTILFTGGGIMPKNLLNLKQLKFIHIHPGYLPNLRGADCFLWSLLLYGRPSASCFYMEEGIDTGKIILSKWLPPMPFRSDFQEFESKILYRAIYAFVDPWIRASVLRDLLIEGVENGELPSTAQDKVEGITYHFMHYNMQRLLFCS